jgi:hypothetical protein
MKGPTLLLRVPESLLPRRARDTVGIASALAARDRKPDWLLGLGKTNMSWSTEEWRDIVGVVVKLATPPLRPPARRLRRQLRCRRGWPVNDRDCQV